MYCSGKEGDNFHVGDWFGEIFCTGIHEQIKRSSRERIIDAIQFRMNRLQVGSDLFFVPHAWAGRPTGGQNNFLSSTTLGVSGRLFNESQRRDHLVCIVRTAKGHRDVPDAKLCC